MSVRSSIDEGEGEGYFASISDLMVGVLFVFLLMLTVFALNFRDAEDQQLVERDRYEQALRALKVAQDAAAEATKEAQRQKEIAEQEALNARLMEVSNQRLRKLLEDAVTQLERDIEARQQLRVAMLQTLERTLMERGVRVSVDTRSGVLRLSGDLLFETGRFELRSEAVQTVRTLAEVLGSVLPCYGEGVELPTCQSAPILETVLVEGHSDRQRFRAGGQLIPLAQSQERNDTLSTQRALAVFQTVRQSQPRLDDLRNGDGLPLLGVSGYGDRRPLPGALGESADDFQRNRRIDIRFVLTSRTSEELERLREQIRSVLGETR